MRILIVSGTCSEYKYQEIYNTRIKPMLDSNQKFFSSLIDGLNTIKEISVDCVTTLPISHSCYKKKLIKSQRETTDGISYYYCGCINLPILRTLIVKRNIRIFVKKYLKQYKDEKPIVLCDGLLAEANALVKILKKRHIPSVAIVTDIPNVVSDMSKGKGLKSFITNVYGKYATHLLQHYDGYVFLTKQMNDVCNPFAKPYMIMECIVTPVKLQKKESSPLSDKPVVLYAGKLHSDFGALQLAKSAPLLCDICEIWLYGGHSNCNTELNIIAKSVSNLKIHDIVTLTEIQRIEQKAAILINPRPNEKSFTKYSFPSKTAEYMMMASPVLMFRLDGVPSEYEPYLNFIEVNSPDGIADSIRQLLAQDCCIRKEKAKNARDFIINNKNNIQQAKRLFEFLKNY